MWAVWFHPGKKSRVSISLWRLLVQDAMQPKNKKQTNKKSHIMLSIIRKYVWNSLLSYSGTKLASIMLECKNEYASRKPQDVHSGTGNLFREVTSQGNGWFSMWELTLKIMRLFSLKLLILWETGIKDHQDSMTCWKQIFIRKSMLIQFYGMIGCGNVMPGLVCYYI